jgi:LuxR family transcriptional regulator, quorum-sensing system regulator BjaR1
MTPDPQAAIAFTERACQIGSIDQLNAAAGAVLAPYGVTSFSANLITAPGRLVRPGILFGHRWLDWSRLYNRKGYAEFDPALAMLRRMSVPFTWSEAQHRFGSPEGARVIRDCLEHTGASEGLVVPVRERDGAVFTAAFSGPDLVTDGAARAMLQLIGHYYVSRGCDLAFDIAFNPICPLTSRQIDCLRWVHEGKTDGEIATILGISPHTAHTHIENAMRALGVTKRAIAARYAYKSGWFDYSD